MMLHTPDLLLPHDRPMTADELRGFNMACGCAITWGRQIAHQGLALPSVQMRPVRIMAEKGLFLVATAEALAMTLGQMRQVPRLRG